MGKDVVSRAWRKVKADWEAWGRRDLAGEDIVRLILDGTVVRVRLDRKATSVSLLVVLGIRRDGQKVLLAIRAMGGESEAAWRAVLNDLLARGLRTPEFLIIDGAAGLEKALAALWPAVPAQRCTVHKHRNLLAHAPERLHEEISSPAAARPAPPPRRSPRHGRAWHPAGAATACRLCPPRRRRRLPAPSRKAATVAAAADPSAGLPSSRSAWFSAFRAALSAVSSATFATNVPTRSRNSASDNVSSSAGSGGDMNRVNHDAPAGATASPRNLPQLPAGGCPPSPGA
ncbi:transposase [Siccirubricoccus sp. G192]|nr:transposase [Siccirubricoccus sp. G192]